MLNLTKPRYVFPFHGDHKRLRLHADLAESVGIDRERHLHGPQRPARSRSTRRAPRFGEDVHAGMIFVDGVAVGEPDEFALRDRRKLSDDGVFIVVATISSDDGSLVADPEVIFRGVPFVEEADGLRRGAARRRRGHARRGRRGRGPRELPAPGGPPRRRRRVRLREAAPPPDGAAGRRRGLSALGKRFKDSVDSASRRIIADETHGARRGLRRYRLGGPATRPSGGGCRRAAPSLEPGGFFM